jgi:UDP-N-acetylmuramoyl-tripeptide--D-alanyl-D-alanine ligase
MSAPVLTLGRMAGILGGDLVQGSPEIPVRGLQHDSRLLQPGEMFFALVSATGDGHAYVAAARERGACAAVVSRVPEEAGPLPLIRVDDTRTALLRFAAWKVADWGGRIVGITGSTGKTTTKEFTAALLEARYTVFRTPGNFNNTLGIPLALFHLEPGHQVAVLEMGMSSAGEIAALCQAAPPDVAVVTNVGTVHLEHFADQTALARAKAEIVDGMKPDGVLVYNIDNPWVREIARDAPGRCLAFGTAPEADIRLEDWTVPDGRTTTGRLAWAGGRHPVALPMLGGHYLLNLAAAVGAALALNVDIPDILDRVGTLRPSRMRGEIREFPDGLRLIDDSYNSNPEAMRAVLESLGRWPGRPATLLVAGEMRELGPESPRLHREVGGWIARLGCELLLGVQGHAEYMVEAARAAGQAARFHSDWAAAWEDLRGLLRPECLLVVKGSRGVGLERLVQAVEKHLSGNDRRVS